MARELSQNAWLYSEMVTTGALIHGHKDRFLAFSEVEQPVALQLGGSDPQDLATCSRFAEDYGYNEVNLNCGCPSPRVQKGAFGACLMQEVNLVADCLKAMQDSVSIDVTVKHRIGVDKQTEYNTVLDFVGDLHQKTDCKTFIVHARNAWLDGLSPKENREIPPLKYDFVYQLKKDFPHLEIILNGGVKTNEDIQNHLLHVDGVMVGREAYHNPMIMAAWDALFYEDVHREVDLDVVVANLTAYAAAQIESGHGTTMRHMARHYLGLMHGLKGARLWRQRLSDAHYIRENRAELISETWQNMKMYQQPKPE
jgi:tRNA-dihydrouridine synthase A